MAAEVWVLLVGYLMSVAGVTATIWQKQLSESRARKEHATQEARNEWWRRYQWAAELAISEQPEQQALGLQVLDSLLRSPLATDSETDMIVKLAEERDESDNEQDRQEDA